MPQRTLEGAEVTPPEGQVVDYVSGEFVRATPEEVGAVQVFSKRLVEEYGYPKEFIQTRPQFRVKESPSGQERWPVDIAVFLSPEKKYDDAYILVECKKPQKKDGEKQLKIYMNLCPASIGVWFNGEEHIYLRKVEVKKGRYAFPEIPTIPRYLQHISDIGKLRRKELRLPVNLKATFNDIRNHLAGNTTGITRDEALAKEIINILFCKIYDEHNTAPDDFVRFLADPDDSPLKVKERLVQLFTEVVQEYDTVFDPNEKLTLDANSIRYVVGELQNYAITDAPREAIGEAFEVFIGPALRGSEGQFFTPRNVVKMMVDVLDPEPKDNIIDPACGSGGFLIYALEYVWRKIEKDGKARGFSDERIWDAKKEVATRYFRGIDKDSFLAKVTKAYMAIVGDGRGGIFCEDSLEIPDTWRPQTKDKISLGVYDQLVTNPPFGTKIRVKGESKLQQYELGHKWDSDKKENFAKRSELMESQTPQILFLERCLQFLRKGGKMGIILPESIFGMPKYRYIVGWLKKNTTILGIVSMPEELFQPNTHAKVCVVFIENTSPKSDYPLLMGIAKWCGHDSRGIPTIRTEPDGAKNLLDDVPLVAERFRQAMKGHAKSDSLGFYLPISKIRESILIPKYYDPEIERRLAELSKTYAMLTIGELEQKGVLKLSTGHEVGKMAYGTGDIPFIRTSDISNLELKADPKQGVSEYIYQKYKVKEDVRPHDILLVRDGTYLVGTSCILSPDQTKLLYCGGIYKIRVNENDLLNPFLLLAILNTPIVKSQVKAKRFTRDVIDTLGGRIREIVLPIPKTASERRKLTDTVRGIIEERHNLLVQQSEFIDGLKA